MSVFKFKEFELSNERAAMKLGTDSVLLGASVDVEGVDSVLDIGTGTGVVALMIAQRTAGSPLRPIIDAIDIDLPSVEEARENFQASPWVDRLKVYHSALQSYPRKEYDLIVSNPPFFDNSLLNPDSRKREARHTCTLSYLDILKYARTTLSAYGRLALILPSEEEKTLIRTAVSYHLYPKSILRIRTVERKVPKRIVVEFCRVMPQVKQRYLNMSRDGEFTPEYRELVEPFLLNV
ncbi:MAG: tRNA1(Val) (adenine(37)-N6)-methyltransferase [Candidatus Cryptobacteroides sp.]